MDYFDDSLFKWQLVALAMLLGSIPFKSLAAAYRKRYALAPRPIDFAGILAGALDIAKVWLPVHIAVNRGFAPWLVAGIGVIGVLSDIFPYWLVFKPRGKGLAAALGAVFGLNPLAGLGALMVWLGVLLVSDRPALAAIVAAISAPVWLSVFGSPMVYVWLGLAGCVYVIIAHSSAIARLIDGSEPGWYRGDKSDSGQH